MPSACFNSSILLEKFKDFKASTCFFVYFLKIFLEKIWLQLEGNISSTLAYSYLSILPDDNVDILAALVLILYCITL